MRTLRIGIYAGTFNPVHAGHIAFALQAMKTAKLDKIYFLPERRPRHKQGVEHFAHRVAMLNRAARPYSAFDVLELDDISFTVKRTLPKLELLFPTARLVMLVGSDTAQCMPEWPLIDQLCKRSELVVGTRVDSDMSTVQRQVATWPVQPLDTHILTSHAPHVSSHHIREALRARRYTQGLLASVSRYSDHHWLYVSLASPVKTV
jgi:nicotinate-nucleotide adenylyltransferase